MNNKPSNDDYCTYVVDRMKLCCRLLAQLHLSRKSHLFKELLLLIGEREIWLNYLVIR